MRTFWDKQSVLQEGVTYETGKAIENEKKITTESIKLPFNWLPSSEIGLEKYTVEGPK